MPKTKLAKRVEWIKRLKKYKNNDPRCHFPWTLDSLGYCWGYACLYDKKNNYIEFCKDCKYWKELL